MKGKRIFGLTILVIITVVLFSANISAQKSTASFLYWQPSAKSYAMGGIGTALHTDIYSAYYNPAALVFSSRMTLTGSFVKPFPFFGNIANSFFGISYKIDESNALALSGNLFWMGKQVITFESSPDPYGLEERPFHWHLKLSYGLKLLENFSAGASFSLLNINLSDITVGEESGDPTTLTVLVDAGIFLRNIIPEATIDNPVEKISYTPFFDWLIEIGEENQCKGISIGLAATNLGPEISYIDAVQSDPPPSKLSLGFTYVPVSLNPIRVIIGSDFEKRLNESNNSDYIHLGSEIKFFNSFVLRGGYFWGTSASSISYVTFGLGLNIKYFSINFARYNRSLQSTWHFDSTISLEF